MASDSVQRNDARFYRKRAEKLLDMQLSSGRILVVDAELTRPEEIKRGMRVALDTFGRIDGLFYATDEISDKSANNELVGKRGIESCSSDRENAKRIGCL